MIFSAELYAAAQRLLAAFDARGLTLATAESCTGGLLGGLLTSVPGSSSVYLGGAVCYANSEKIRLGVAPYLIEQHGAVSADVAEALALSVAKATGAAFGIGITGIAGPGGGSAEKPVGLVYSAVSGKPAQRYIFSGTRDDVRMAAVAAAIKQLLDSIVV
ncbi:MAG: nicotinamide-nucleotide amidohydrolase family protein [Alphaproteobacteria bacterium]|jgi:PncC family amidohydrolase|nr:nicotinamide-nucleotide amidohydrolase family protein [Alphaproteobacteria bacterium]